MYEIRFKGSKAKKDFKRLQTVLSKDVNTRIIDTLENNPYPTPTLGKDLNKIVQKGRLFCYPVSGGNRILFDIIEITKEKKIVLIHFAGNDDEQIRYLRKYAK